MIIHLIKRIIVDVNIFEKLSFRDMADKFASSSDTAVDRECAHRKTGNDRNAGALCIRGERSLDWINIMGDASECIRT